MVPPRHPLLTTDWECIGKNFWLTTEQREGALLPAQVLRKAAARQQCGSIRNATTTSQKAADRPGKITRPQKWKKDNRTLC